MRGRLRVSRTDNDEGLILGRKLANYRWPKYQAYFNGTARVTGSVRGPAELTPDR